MDTSSANNRKAPSAGTKVTPGQNAPAVRETAGTVPSESLAAESYRRGGEFAANPGSAPQNIGSQTRSDGETLSAAPDASARADAHVANLSSGERYDEATGRADPPPASYAGAAPSYVTSQYHRDPAGPHGKDVSEGDWDHSAGQEGLRKALNAEPGSINDPGRLAEQGFQLKQSAGGRSTGPKDQEVDNETRYDNLNSDVPA